MTQYLAIDIETIPNPAMVERLPGVKAKANLIDEVKINADIQEKKQKQLDSMALNPLYGQIACVGMFDGYNKRFLIGGEKEILTQLFAIIREKQLITFNGKGFDLDFIIKRGIINGVCKLSELEKYTSRYAKTHTDLMVEWCKYGEYISLNELAYALLGKKKIDFDVKEIPELVKTEEGRAKLEEYCMHDVMLTWELSEFMGVVPKVLSLEKIAG